MSITPYGDGGILGDPEEIPNPNDDLALQDESLALPDIDTDERVIAEQVFQALADRVPGWVAHDANLETWLIEAFSAVGAELRSQAANVPSAIYVTYGTEVLGVPIRVPAPATGTSRWVARDEAGYTIPVDTQFTLQRAGDEWVAFRVTQTSEITPGDTQVANVPITAVEDGVRGNSLSGEGEVVDPLSWISEVYVDLPTSGGDDGETQDQYLDHLVSLLRMVALRPVLAGDYATLALETVGIGRAVAMDGYDPATGTWGHARTVTIIVTDTDGRVCAAPIKASVERTLESLREVNFVVNVIDPSYVTVSVDYTVTAFSEQNPVTVQEYCDEALTNALLPARYRLGVLSPSIAAGEVIPPPTETNVVANRRIIRVNDIIALLDRVRGVDFVESVTINGGGDYTLPSPTTLPEPGTITGTVNTQ